VRRVSFADQYHSGTIGLWPPLGYKTTEAPMPQLRALGLP
jgi:hypothetical protein